MTSSGVLVEALGAVRAEPARAAILLDIDGTLAPIVRHADEAHVPEGTRQLLIGIARRYGVTACVSGRRASDSRRLVAIGTMHYLGGHGTELLRAGWTEPVVEKAVAEWTRRVQGFVHGEDTAALRRLRVRLEDKSTVVAFHWRGAPDEGAARAAVEAVAARAGDAGLATHWGRKVLEVRPPVRMDKGAGIVSFLAHEDVDAALYVGDDATDLDAFRALDELVEEGRLERALRVGVRSPEGPSGIVEQADLVVEGTDGVLRLLEALLTREA